MFYLKINIAFLKLKFADICDNPVALDTCIHDRDELYFY